MARQLVATLLTDFGMRDPYVATMKGMMISMVPEVHIVDICHGVLPHDVLGAAFILAEAAPAFPPGTVHVVAVDPSVEVDRSILAARFGGHLFVFPDNGVITFVSAAAPLEQMAIVRDKRYFASPEPSSTFQGRDIYAPVAAQLLRGLDMRRLGPPPETFKLLDLPAVADDEGDLAGQVIYVDRFGNVISNITASDIRQRWANPDRLHVFCQKVDCGPLRGTYGAVDAGQPVALINSMGLLEIAVNRGRASLSLKAAVGTKVYVCGKDSQ
ncbi:MAG TPA: SAM-dependent chlorinase/fluorinase [Phycisphaerae bacterium]|nr:SAM-dependent chlorinase/fluorinase [Phycisphaerae bacterium]